MDIADMSTRPLDVVSSLRRAPLDMAPAILHEFTHHSTFYSPVGRMLSEVFTSGALGLLLDGSSDTTRFKDQLLRYHLVQDLLRPLIEGVALFCEFDAINRGSESLGRAYNGAEIVYNTVGMTGFMWLFSPGKELGGSPTPAQLHAVTNVALGTVRLSQQVRARKIDVYGMPAGPDGEGYLLGYLAVKRVWTLISQRIPWLALESDTFLGFLIDFIFQDFGLFNLVLDPRTISDAEFLQRAQTHLLKRLRLVAHEVTSRELGAWLRPGLSKHGFHTHDNVPEAYRVHTFYWDQGRDRGKALQRRLLGMRRHPVMREKIESLLWILVHRSLIHLGTLQVRVEIRDGTFFMSRDGKIYEEGESLLSAESSRAEGNGRVEVFFVVDEGVTGKLSCLYHGDDLVGAWSYAIPEMRDAVTRLGLENMDTWQAANSAYVDLVASAGPAIDAALTTRRLSRAELEDTWAKVYGPFVSDPSSSAGSVAVIDRLKPFGLYGPLRGDRDLLGTLARIGLEQSVSPDGLYQPTRGDVRQVESIVEAQRRAGLLLVSWDGTAVRAHV